MANKLASKTHAGKAPTKPAPKTTKTATPNPAPAPAPRAQKAGSHASGSRKSGSRAKPAPAVAIRDGPKPVPARALAKAARQARKPAPEPIIAARRDSLDPEGSVAARLLKQLRNEVFEFNRAESKAKFDESAFYEFFGAEIDAELAKHATIYNDRFARWPCQCCDVVIPVPRRTEVFHGDYHLVHDDIMGLLVNGERWIPKAETPIEVVQPGRLRNPWTGKTLTGRDLGTTGVVV